MENKWKKAASFAMSLALVAANSAISLSNSCTTVAKAAEANAQVVDATALITAANEQRIDESYYDEETQTLHLKGDVRNGGEFTGLILPDDVNAEEIKHIVADEGTVLPVDCSWLMYNLNQVKTVDLKNADSSNVENMSYMFVPYTKAVTFEASYPSGCIREIDLTGFNTSSVTDMSGMFYYTSVESLDLSSFDTSNVTDMSEMFACCFCIKSLELSSFDTSNVTDMSRMFEGWWHIPDYVDISGFDTSKVTDMSGMFYFGGGEIFDLTNFDTSNVTNMYEMFGYSGFRTLDISSFDTSKVTDMSYMFICGPETIYVGPDWTTELAVGSSMFEDCYGLKGGEGTLFDYRHDDKEYAHVDGGVNDPGYLTFKDPQKNKTYFDAETGTIHLKGKVEKVLPDGVDGWDVKHIIAEEGTILPADCSYFIDGLSYIESIDLKNADTSNVTDMSYMFSDSWLEWDAPELQYKGIKSLDLSNFDTSNVTNMKGMFRLSRIDELDLSSFNTSNVTDMSEMFERSSIKSVDLSSFDTSHVTDMSQMFWGCSQLSEIDLSSFDTSNVTDMKRMFCDCSGLKECNLSGFNTANVTNTNEMFSDCRELEGIDVSSFDTSKVTTMRYMFAGCSKLNSLNISNFNTSNVDDMRGMFAWCYDLEAIDLSNLDTSNVTETGQMFECCNNLVSLDLSSFDTNNVTDFDSMFYNCCLLETITVGDGWSTKSSEHSGYSMFSGCEKIKGSEGTVYDDEHTGIEYAHIDGGNENPGYFTEIKTDAEEDTDNTIVIPEEAMNTVKYLYSNINDPTLKGVADAAIRLFNRFFSYRIV